MKMHIISSVILGLLSVGVLANDSESLTEYIGDNGNTTTEHDNTTITEGPSGNISTTVNTSTTEVISTTTPEPTPTPSPDLKTGSWNVTENNNTCIKLDAAIQFHINYAKKDGETGKATLNVPETATTVELSSCPHVIGLTFGKNSFVLTFDEKDSKVFIKDVNIAYYLNNETFPDAEKLGSVQNETKENMTLFSVPSGKSYFCKTESKIELDNTTVTLKNLQVEAYRNTTKTGFSDYEECSSDEKINDIVPIAVGCALAALVIIVLIAYLVGRQRARQRGYQSV